MDEQAITLNEEEMVDFIFEQLVSKGYAVSKDAILVVLDAELDYMVKIGLAQPMEQAPPSSN